MMAHGRRQWLKATLAALGMVAADRKNRSFAAPSELALPAEAPTREYDVGASGIDAWTVVSGQWAVEELADSPSGKRVLVQRATRNQFNVIVTPDVVTDADVSVKFRPMSGREDASGGLVFRYDHGRYYVARANALESNFRLYFYDRERRQIATANVKAPALGQWHTIRLVAVADHIQAWLDGVRYLDHRDARLQSGRIGLWTKADSVTAFSGLTVRART
jgi:hypothetical protein